MQKYSPKEVTCIDCGETTPALSRLLKRCPACKIKYRNKYANDLYKRLAKNPDYRRVKGLTAKRHRENNLEAVLVRGAKYRAKLQGLEFSISKEDVEVPEVCPALLTPFQIGTPYAASLDRKDPSKGYIKGNVQVMSRKANLMKNNSNTEELVRFAEWVKKNYQV